MKITVAQLNPTIGDLGSNVDRLAQVVSEADGSDLVVAPELAVSGYPPRDLLNSTEFRRDTVDALRSLVARVRGPALLCGSIVSAGDDPLTLEDRVANGAVFIRDGVIEACHRKVLLPTYDVFDEARYFEAGDDLTVATVAGVPIGLTVCEDIWNDEAYWGDRRYDRDPAAEAVEAGAKLIVNVSASPYARCKSALRHDMLTALGRHLKTPVLYVNQIGGNDSLIFDGRSLAVDAEGAVTLRLPVFEESVVTATFDGRRVAGPITDEPASWEADVTGALTLGIADYMRKCGFSTAVIGLSGGIDSALTCTLAVRALGKENVIGLSMPSRYSSQGSRDDAAELARRLGIRMDTVPIKPMFDAFLKSLEEPFAGMPADVTEQNLQARIRGALLMAYSNKLGALLLTTGNKSELAVGYATLYGDMCGGLAVISDLYKTQVFDLSRYINAEHNAPIPENSITKPPSAELAPDQRDEDELPPYEKLDSVLQDYVDELKGLDELLTLGHDPALVRRVIKMVDRTEYKRRQMPPGLRVSCKAFGEGRRLPIAQRYGR